MIKIENLTFSYENEDKKVLDNINLTVNKGEFLCVLGHNGSGKSTLAKHFNAILLPMGGNVYVDKFNTLNEDEILKIRQRVAMVFQNPDNQIVATIVEEDVAFAAENLGIDPLEIRKRVDEALDAVGMLKFKKHAPHMLSGGQKQRIAIAGVIAMKPDYIVFDEPTAMLDPVGRREVIKTIKKLNKEYGITIILITHNMDEAAKADRIIVMDKGEIVKEGTPREIFCDVEKMRELGLDTPSVTSLAYELSKCGINIKRDILEIDECVEEILKLCQ
ncbi:MAG: energy-coupling factor transporter ATPase [Ruminococcaceae bacterium]|nr:energy-coupling factor transporter ATPase [Oscillospiraceae bacterium]